MAYGWFWSASPAGEENKLIFRAHLFCVDPKLSRTWTFLFFFFPFHFFFFAQQQSILKRFLEKRRVQFLCIHFKRRWWFGTEVYGVIVSHLTPCHRHFITVKINRLLFIPKSKNDSLSFLGRVSKNYYFIFFPMLHRKHKRAQSVLSCTFMEMWTLHPVEYIVMVFHHQKIVLSSPLPFFWSS